MAANVTDRLLSHVELADRTSMSEAHAIAFSYLDRNLGWLYDRGADS